MQPIDWIIVVAFLAVLVVGALSTRRHAQDVAGWLAARRCAGRYLISTAQNMAQLGVITLVWFFQQILKKRLNPCKPSLRLQHKVPQRLFILH